MEVITLAALPGWVFLAFDYFVLALLGFAYLLGEAFQAGPFRVLPEMGQRFGVGLACELDENGPDRSVAGVVATDDASPAGIERNEDARVSAIFIR